MQRISVDLPEPDGPQMTIFSPSFTSRLMSDRTWNCPNHLLTAFSSITEATLERSRAAFAAMVVLLRLAARPLVKFDLEILAVPRHREAEDEIDEGGEQIDLGREACPVGIHERPVGGIEEVEDADDQ